MDIRELTSRIGENLSVRRAFGAAYEKNGVLVIPVALVAGGGGGGQRASAPPQGQAPSLAANPADDADPGRESRNGAEAGGGFGGLIMPIGAYVVKGDDVRWVPAVNVTVIVLASLSTIRLLALLWTRRRRRASR
jgi:uncharacterized spore protein YtfJ